MDHEFYEYPCACQFCENEFYHGHRNDRVTDCLGTLKTQKHTRKVSQLYAIEDSFFNLYLCRPLPRRLIASPDIVTLFIGPEGARLTCHKALLRYASERFDALLGDCESIIGGEIKLRDELFELMSIWVAWLYTGRIPPACKLSPEVLWILGARLESPAFRNEAMLGMFSRYSQLNHDDEYGYRYDDLTPDMADYIYENTTKGSKLRNFVVEWVLLVGPLGKRGSEMEGKWRRLIRRKGELVADVALKGSFINGNDGPNWEGWHYADDLDTDYFESIPTRPIEDFIGKNQSQGI